MQTIKIEFGGETIELPMPEGNFRFFRYAKYEKFGEWFFDYEDIYSYIYGEVVDILESGLPLGAIICMIAECHFRDLAINYDARVLLHKKKLALESAEKWRKLRERLPREDAGLKK